jgi:hypothetical protein
MAIRIRGRFSDGRSSQIQKNGAVAAINGGRK